MKSAVKHQTIDLSKTQEKGDKILQEMLNISLEGSHQDTDEVKPLCSTAGQSRRHRGKRISTRSRSPLMDLHKEMNKLDKESERLLRSAKKE